MNISHFCLESQLVKFLKLFQRGFLFFPKNYLDWFTGLLRKLSKRHTLPVSTNLKQYAQLLTAPKLVFRSHLWQAPTAKFSVHIKINLRPNSCWLALQMGTFVSFRSQLVEGCQTEWSLNRPESATCSSQAMFVWQIVGLTSRICFCHKVPDLWCPPSQGKENSLIRRKRRKQRR